MAKEFKTNEYPIEHVNSVAQATSFRHNSIGAEFMIPMNQLSNSFSFSLAIGNIIKTEAVNYIAKGQV